MPKGPSGPSDSEGQRSRRRALGAFFPSPKGSVAPLAHYISCPFFGHIILRPASGSKAAPVGAKAALWAYIAAPEGAKGNICPLRGRSALSLPTKWFPFGEDKARRPIYYPGGAQRGTATQDAKRPQRGVLLFCLKAFGSFRPQRGA